MNEAPSQKIATNPDDVAVLKKIIRGLGRNMISRSDLSPLAGLTSLTYLDLSHNYISDLSPLAGLTKLTRLGLSWKENLRDLSPLTGLTALTNLNLFNNNNISDLSPLAKLGLKEKSSGEYTRHPENR